MGVLAESFAVEKRGDNRYGFPNPLPEGRGVVFGGHLMGGSLQLLVGRFPGSRLSLDPIGRLFGEAGFGPLSQAITGALEGALFCAWVVAAMLTAARGSDRRSPTASGA